MMKNQPKVRRGHAAAIGPRRGVALLLVLGTISVVMALSYAMLRSQTVQLMVHENSSRTLDARQAAMAGMNLALQKIHDSSWAGVGTTLNGSLGTGEAYSVSFTTGDASLSEGDADYDDYPWRVTLLSTGTVTDASSGVSATHQIQTVVQLVPRQLSDEPDGWESVAAYTLYQWGSSDAEFKVPCHVDGAAYLAGPLKLCEDFPFDAKPFEGSIDELAVYDTAYSGSDVLYVFWGAYGFGSYVSLADAYTDQTPIAWWRFDEVAGSTVAADERGHYDGTYVEADPGSTGVSGRAAQFDGTDDYIDVGVIDISGAAMTIFAWIKADSVASGDTRIISKAVANSSSDHYWSLGTTNVSGTTRLTGSVKTANGTYIVTAPNGSSITPGQFYFVAMTLESGRLTIYQNGSLAAWAFASGNLAESEYGTVFIGDDAPGSSRGQYLRDLNAIRLAGGTDNRPLTGPVSLSVSSADRDSYNMLTENLGVTTNNISPTHSAPSSFPEGVTTYQLYTGGKQYSVETLSSSVSSTNKKADPVSNPLGVFHATGDVYFSGSTKFVGTALIEMSGSTGGTLDLTGTGNNFEAVDLPPLYGTTTPIQLPVVIAENDVVARASSETTISGMVWSGDTFESAANSASGQLDIEGSVVAKTFHSYGNSFWASMGESVWQDAVALFRLQKINDLDLDVQSVANWSVFFYLPNKSFNYFPDLLDAALNGSGTFMDPVLTLQPKSIPVSYHWHDWSEPIFVPHPDDGGLRWDLIKWTDSP